MDAEALNLTTETTGFGRFLFLHLAPERVDSALLQSLDALGARIENMHFADGNPSITRRDTGSIPATTSSATSNSRHRVRRYSAR